MNKSTRYLRSEIKKGAHRLGDKVAFLEKANYLAVSKQKQRGKALWCVEVAFGDFQKLLESKRRSLKRKHRVSELKLQLAQLMAEVDGLKATNSQIEANNAQLLRNIEEDRKDTRYDRSPKNYLNVAQERAVKGVNPLPYQGGLAGIEGKK